MRSPFLLSLACVLAALPAGAQSYRLSVPELPLPEALNAVSEQTGQVIIAGSDDLPWVVTRPLDGEMTLPAALDFLLAETELTARQEAGGGAWIVKAGSKAGAETPDALPDGDRQPYTLPRIDTVMVYDTVIVTGTRSGLPAIESMSPVQVLGETDISGRVSDDLADILAELVPSFYVQRRPLSDGAVFVRPYSLRNLPADHTLVLINGKRRHRSAMLNMGGSQSSDLSMIPANAIGHIEVLRDAASAQYGSDAIAGVINIITDTDARPEAFAQYSQYYEGDGTQVRFGTSGGWRNTSGGARITFDYSDAAATSRARQRQDALEYLEAHPEVILPDPVQKWGQPEREDFRTLATADYDTGLGRLYALGSYSWGQGVSDFNWRSPDAPSAYSASPAFGTWTLREVYPHGFKPQFGQDEQDAAATLGIRGETAGGLDYDLSFGAGRNRIDYFLYDTINASMGPDSPLSFDAGGLQQTEYILNADLQKDMSMPALSRQPADIAFGFEYRIEEYGIRAGDPDSYRIGPGAADGLTSGSNGFPGYTPLQARTYLQRSSAAYADVSLRPRTSTRLGLAARYEHFALYGDRLNGKLSLRQDVTEGLVLRATASTAFKAPTPAQLYSERTSQGVDAGTLDIFTNGRFTPTGPVAGILNQRPELDIRPLEPEVSTNLSAGLVWRPSGTTAASIDAYAITVNDRIFNSETFTLTDDEQDRLAALGFPGGESITRVQFHQNDFDTRTSGIDISVDHERALSGGTLNLSLSGNYNRTEVLNATAWEQPRVEQFEQMFPEYAVHVSARYRRHGMTLDGKLRVVGPWADYSDQNASRVQTFGMEAFVDLGVRFDLSGRTAIRIGAENLFNAYPDEATLEASKGLIYSRNAPYDTDGGLFYVRFDAAL